MRSRDELKPFQLRAIEWLAAGNRGAIFADMGSGKTVITLTHIVDHNDSTPLPALVISTKRVCELVWEDEALNWEHTQHLTFSEVMGTPAQRRDALNTKADIYLINVENIQWLMTNYPKAAFWLVILDELSLWKGMGERWKAVRKWLADDIDDVIGLTGTPVTNGYEGLWPQMELIEPGLLGRTMTLYRQRHFWQMREHIIELKPGEDLLINNEMSDFVHRISNAELDMPELVENDIKVRIEIPLARQMIAEFRQEDYLLVESAYKNYEISGDSAATAINKLVQMGNGSVYCDTGEVVFIHNAKELATIQYINEQQGAPVMIAYYYKHDLAAIKRACPTVDVFDGDLTKAEAERMKADWNAGDIPVIAIHPGSAGHGLNMQEGHANRLLWYSMVWDLDLYDQLNARLCRQGNDSKTVWIDRLIASPEDRIIAKALTKKTNVQDALLAYFQERQA